MGFRRHVGLAVMLVSSLAAASRASADVADITLLGDQANLMSGAVTASTQGGPSMWYNPARLSFAAEQSYVLSVSGVGAALRLYRIPHLIRTPTEVTEGKTSEVLTLPRATTLVAQGREALRWGLGLFVPVLQDVTLRAVQATGTSEERAFTAVSSNVRRQSVHLVGAASYSLGSRLKLGASVDLVGYYLYRSSELSSAVYDATSGVARAQINNMLQRDNLGYGFSAKVGASVELREHLLLGVSLATPTKVIYSFVDELRTNSSATTMAGSYEPERTDENGGTWETVESGLLRVGLAWETKELVLEVDGEVASSADSDDFEVHSGWSGNVKAGAVVGLARNLRLGAGFFTDLDHPREPLEHIGDTRMRGLGGTLGVNVISRLPGQTRDANDPKGTFSLTASTRYIHYQGDVQTLEVDPGQAESVDTPIGHGTIHDIALQVGVNAAW